MLAMELQLGLALPTHNPMKGFDLNQNGFEFEPKEMGGWWNECCLGIKIHGNKKRSFGEAFEDDGGERNGKLCLLSWSGQPNEEDDGRGERKGSSNTIDKDDEEENHVVGWPPIKSWRKKQMLQHQGGGRNRIVKDRTVERGSTNSTYVKVKMEGVPIGRKIDLRLYHSYQTLTNTLITMFAKYDQDCSKNRARYTLTYQDKEGDWLLAGDVPWQTFMESVRRLEIIRNVG